MRLPDVAEAVINREKIKGYLLSTTHPVGRFKARFFRRLGFTADRWEELADALVRHAVDHEVAESDDTEFGTRYTINGRAA